MSDVAATTQTGAVTAAPAAAAAPSSAPVDNVDAFQSFWDNSVEEDRRDDTAQTGQNDAQRAGQQEDAASLEDATRDAQNGQQTPAPEQPEAPQYASLTELLTAHKIDPESVMGLHVTTKIDGVETQVPLADVLKSYQLEGHVNNKSIQLSNDRTAFENDRVQFQQAAQQQIRTHQEMGNLAMAMLNQDFQKIDWNTLRAHNPAEFAALQADFQSRQAQIGQYMQNVNALQQQEAQRQHEAMRQAVAGENDRLLGARPEWRDQQVFTKDRETMSQYARSLGFKDAELSQIFDHRYMLVLHDAARYRALQAAAPNALKQVRQAPLMGAPGSRTDTNPSEAQRKQAMERFNRNPRDVDAQAAAFQHFADQ